MALAYGSAWILVWAPASSLAGEQNISDTRALMDKWVETRQVTARTRADWIAEKETLTNTLALFQRELAALGDVVQESSSGAEEAVKALRADVQKHFWVQFRASEQKEWVWRSARLYWTTRRRPGCCRGCPEPRSRGRHPDDAPDHGSGGRGRTH